MHSSHLAALVALAALAACGPSAPPAAAPEAAPVTDAGPRKPEPAAPTAHDALIGRWGVDAAACTPGNDSRVGLLDIEKKLIVVGLEACRISTSAAEPDGAVRAATACSAGSAAAPTQTEFLLRLKPEGALLAAIGARPEETYSRCAK